MNTLPAAAAWREPFAPREPWLYRATRFAFIAAIHLAALIGLAGLAAGPQTRAAARELVVRLIEVPRSPALPDLPKPSPTSTPIRHTTTSAAVLTAAEPVMAAPAIVASALPAAPSADPPAPPAKPTTPNMAPARFDADYLANPRPPYPLASRRLREEGRVELRVRVSTDGAALDVELRQSSGSSRLDAAARDAVAKWRFVPARRGDETIESWVGVPIVFKLES
jgi:protein TonB